MYGGLFGDLPPEKSSSGETTAAANSNGDEEKSNVEDESNKKARMVQEPKSTKSSGASSSLVKNLGVAGTTMAFVPTAALQRKRNAATKATTKTSAASQSKSKTQPQNSSFNVKTEPVVTTNFDLPTWKDAAENETSTGTEDRALSVTSETQSVEKGEAEEIRQLHESVTDPYDPLVPNDLLQYWERQAAILERQELEREARETMETQKRIREQLEAERLELEKSGDVDKLVEYQQRRGAGRGRGRGISNLPAWYVEKQKKEAEGRLQPPPEDKKS